MSFNENFDPALKIRFELQVSDKIMNIEQQQQNSFECD